ncbi:MAG: phosphopeptide-binding protein [Flavobacteriaceae bacterium]|nr:phosphopeptide-binding protein [Flavobacteriaceae bacterium]
MKIYLFLVVSMMVLLGCKNSNEVYNSNGIKVYENTILTSFPEAKLIIKTEDSKIHSGKNNFEFYVNSYTLKEQTQGENTNDLANSKKGQHIHFIVNNGPYQAKYNPVFEANLDTGSNLVLAFLSRSFHESVKEKDAYVLKHYQFNNEKPQVDIKKDPLLFYSRPKGTYQFDKGDKILLDFYLVNTKLDKSGNKVKVTLNNHPFTLDKWKSYIIEGLKKGEHEIQIELIDAKGIPVPGPYNNSGIRKFTIK